VGTGDPGFAGDGGPPLQAQLHLPAGSNPQPAGSLAFGPASRLYISDSLNNRIRVVDFDNNRIDTFAGTGDRGFSGDGGSALSATFDNPRDLLFTSDGRLLVADELNHRIRAIDLQTGIITTVAGNGVAGFSGDGGPAVSASLNRPAGIEEDAMGRLIIADTYNHSLRRVNL
jgi:DNA-binding beta-propeller fold protein YncE